MVAGKVKSAMGLQKPKTEPAAKPHPPSHKANSGGRSFGVYFPRSSAQVQPRPPDVTELLRIIEELGEREALLRNELVEQKLVRESAAIVPVLENEIQIRDLEIDKFRRKIECLEDENQRVRNENEFLHMELSKQNHKYEEKIKYMQSELLEIKRAVTEQEAATAAANLKLVDVTNSYKSNFAAGRCLRKCQTQSNIVAGNFPDQSAPVKKEEFNTTVESYTERPKLSSPEPSDSLIEIRSRAPRIPRPPPRPSSSPDSSDRALAEISNVPPPPPPPPPPSSLKRAPPPPPPPPPPPSNSKTSAPPPPPPPPKGLKPKPAVAKVRRIPEVVEFYHSLMRRDCNFRRDSGGGGGADAASAGVKPKDMIGEIENRSSHLLAIKTDVETQGDFIRSLIKEVEGAAFSDIEDVVPFVKWLDDELSYLVDERAVLKHFEWPEQKADALREAAFGFVDLKKLESEVSLFRDDPRQPCTPALKKIQSLFEKLEHRVYNLSRMRESASKRYKLYRIPMDWMLDTGYVSQIKLASVKLAMKYMKRVSAEVGSVGGGGPEEEELIVQGVKFAFRVHQFAGGFDMETMRAFKELRDKAEACQNHNKFNGRPSY